MEGRSGAAGRYTFRTAMPPRFVSQVSLLKAVALAKLGDMTILSAEFLGEQVVFETWLTLLIDDGDKAMAFGVYRQAFPPDEPEPDDTSRPDIYWRRAEWDRDRDLAQFDRATDKHAYLRDEPPTGHSMAFTRLADEPDLARLIHDSLTMYSRGVTVQADHRPNPPWGGIRADVADSRITYSIDYSLPTARCNPVEQWAQSWIDHFHALNPDRGIAPDGDVTVSHRRSLHDILSVYSGS